MLLENYGHIVDGYFIANDPKENGAIPLTYLGIIKVSGPDAVTYLQGQLTIDMLKLNDHQAALGAHCTAQGRVTSLFMVLKDGDTIWLIPHISMVEKSIQALKKYAMFSNVDISDESGNKLLFGYINSANVGGYQWQNDMTIQLVDTNHLPEGPYRNTVDWHIANMKLTKTEVYPETSSELIPQRLNLEELDAIHFNKGCYLGQAIISRLHFKAKIKFHTYCLQFESDIKPPLLSSVTNDDGKKIGTIVDTCLNNGECFLLAILQDEFTGTPLHYEAHALTLLETPL